MPARIEIDLRAKVIGENQKIFMVRPGSNYKLYNLFLERSGIFADLLGLELSHGTSLSEQDRIIAQLHRARRLRAVRRSGESEPPRDLDHYTDYSNNRGISQLRRILKGFFEDAQKGDLVLVPPSSFSKDALIGELTTEPSNFTTTKIPELYGNEQLFGREVRWLARMPKGKLSPYLLDLISKPNAFVSIRKDETYALFREAYGSYILPGEFRARFDVDDPEFTTTDDLFIQAFFSFVAANSKLIEEEKKPLAVFKAARMRELGDHKIELQSSINSPGYLNLISPKVGPLVASALLALAVAIGPDAVEAAEAGTIVIGNSLDADDDCTVEVAEEVLQHLRLLGVDKWAEACQIAREAADSTGLKGQDRVTINDGTGGN